MQQSLLLQALSMQIVVLKKYDELFILGSNVLKFLFLIFQTPDEEPIYICVDGEEEEVEPVKPPPVYHVLEDLTPNDESGTDPQDMNDEC